MERYVVEVCAYIGATKYFKYDNYTEKPTLHRTEGPAIEYTNGSKYWYRDGVPHRDGGPAVESSGQKQWYQNGVRHREDGPAYEIRSSHSGNLFKEWWLNGENYTEEGFEKEMAKRNAPTCDGKMVEIDGKKYLVGDEDDIVAVIGE